jgi:hypothetical protein
MNSQEEHEKAIKLYIKYDRCAADVIRELRCNESIRIP